MGQRYRPGWTKEGCLNCFSGLANKTSEMRYQQFGTKTDENQSVKGWIALPFVIKVVFFP